MESILLEAVKTWKKFSFNHYFCFRLPTSDVTLQILHKLIMLMHPACHDNTARTFYHMKMLSV